MNYRIKSRIWIESSQGVFLGEGRIQLLKGIIKEGSLNKAAKELRMSYKKALKLVDAINESAAEAVVIAATGGAGGGGSIVTPYGKKMIETFDKINVNCWKYLDEQLAIHTPTINS